MKCVYSFFFSNYFILIVVIENLEPVLGTFGMRCEYTLDRMHELTIYVYEFTLFMVLCEIINNTCSVLFVFFLYFFLFFVVK